MDLIASYTLDEETEEPEEEEEQQQQEENNLNENNENNDHNNDSDYDDDEKGDGVKNAKKNSLVPEKFLPKKENKENIMTNIIANR